MSALGQKQTLRSEIAMSAIPPKADIAEQRRHVRLVPKADIATAEISAKCQARIGELRTEATNLAVNHSAILKPRVTIDAYPPLARLCLPGDHSVCLPDGATLIARSFQAFIGNFRPQFLQLCGCRFVGMTFSIIRSPWHLGFL
jgi:hypothetical protein